MSHEYYLSIRWAGMHLFGTRDSDLKEVLPRGGMAGVHALSYGDDPLVGDILVALMPTVFEEDHLVALDLQGRELAHGDDVWDCQGIGADDGVYLGVRVSQAALAERWTTCRGEIRRILRNEYGDATGNCMTWNLRAFVRRIGDLDDQGLRPLVHIGGYNYAWRRRGAMAWMLGEAKTPWG